MKQKMDYLKRSEAGPISGLLGADFAVKESLQEAGKTQELVEKVILSKDLII